MNKSFSYMLLAFYLFQTITGSKHLNSSSQSFPDNKTTKVENFPENIGEKGTFKKYHFTKKHNEKNEKSMEEIKETMIQIDTRFKEMTVSNKFMKLAIISQQDEIHPSASDKSNTAPTSTQEYLNLLKKQHENYDQEFKLEYRKFKILKKDFDNKIKSAPDSADSQEMRNLFEELEDNLEDFKEDIESNKEFLQNHIQHLSEELLENDSKSQQEKIEKYYNQIDPTTSNSSNTASMSTQKYKIELNLLKEQQEKHKQEFAQKMEQINDLKNVIKAFHRAKDSADSMQKKKIEHRLEDLNTKLKNYELSLNNFGEIIKANEKFLQRHAQNLSENKN